jgi:hypothetical protein
MLIDLMKGVPSMVQPYERRNIALCIVLSIVTCGIYYIYWYYCIARDFYNSNTPNRIDTSPGMIILLDIITCGIYGIYVYYKWGKQTQEIYNMYGLPGEDKSTMYLVLAIVTSYIGLGFIVDALIQNDLNMLSNGPGQPYGGQPPYNNQQPPYGNPPPPPPGSPYNP